MANNRLGIFLFALSVTILSSKVNAQGTITRKRNNKEKTIQGSYNRNKESSLKKVRVPTQQNTPQTLNQELSPEEELQNGYDYQVGTKGKQRDDEEAFHWFKKAAERGNPKAMYELYGCYNKGKGCSKNQAKALEYLLKAAQCDYVHAQYELGILYWLGEDYPDYLVKKNYRESFLWLEKAAQKGDKIAQCMLGSAHEEGRGCERNMEKAKYWYKKSADQGYEPAVEHLRDINK